MLKTLMAILVPIALGITAFIAADAAQPPDKGNKSGTSFSIYIEMAAGDPDVTIVESGPLEVFARCVTGSGGAVLTTCIPRERNGVARRLPPGAERYSSIS